MSAHITTTYVEQMIGTSVCSGLADSTALTTMISAASAKVDMALVNAGYDIPSVANDSVKLATLGALLPDLYGRRGLQVPQQMADSLAVWRAIGTGEIMLPGMDPSVRSAVGGHTFSEQSATMTSGRPNIFNGLRKVF